MVDLVENGNTTMLARRLGEPQQTTALAVYDRVDPMDFIEKMGKAFGLSQAAGCKSESEGKLMALACLCERKNIFEIARRYHLMGGKLVLKAETMLADFRRAGGKHKWIKDGTDRQTASLELIDKDGNKLTSTFHFATAVAAGYVKDGSQWKKRPDQMLRSRAITDGVRMLCPEISSGEFVEEEVYDEPLVTSSMPTAVATAAPIRSAAEVKSRQAELQATATGPVVATKSVTEQIIDVQSEPVGAASSKMASSPTTETAPFEGGTVVNATNVVVDHDANTKVIMEIELTIKQAGLTIETVINAVNKKNNTSYATLDDLPEDSALTLLENLRNVIKQQQEKAAAAV